MYFSDLRFLHIPIFFLTTKQEKKQLIMAKHLQSKEIVLPCHK